MKRNHFALTALAAALAMTQTPALATNGYFLPGSGIRSMGMGGVGIAYGRDSLSIGANPANVTKTGMRADMGMTVFNAERHAKIGVTAGELALAEAPGTNPVQSISPFGFVGAAESDIKYYLVPEMGFTMPLTERVHVGLAFLGAGMGTNYPLNFFSYTPFDPDKPAKDSKLGVDLMQLVAPLTLGYTVNEDHAIGAALVLAATRFRAYGLEAFVHFDQFGIAPLTSDPDHLTGKGYDYSYGAGFKLGWLGEFLDDKLTIGLVYNSRTYMTKFDKYRGLFAEQGDFDIPESYGIGIAVKPAKNLIIAADVVRINYNDIASVGNRGPGTSPLPYGVDPNPQRGIPSFEDPTKKLGNDDGMGFGWENQTVYKLGVQYGVNNRLLVRAGYNYGASPIADDQLTFNVLAPATVEHHYSVGFTYRANDNLEVTGMYMYVAPNNQLSPLRQNVVAAAETGMHQNMFSLNLSWVLEDGPGAREEYGEGNWDGINFDGWYGGFNFGQSKFRDVVADSADTRSEAWKVYTGYQFSKYLGVEGGYTNLNDMTARAGAVTTNMAVDAWTLGAVLSYPLTDKLSVMGKLGAAYMVRDIKIRDGIIDANHMDMKRVGDDSYQPNYGVGVSYALLDFLSLRAEWERFDTKGSDIDLMTAGFAMKF